MGALKYCPMEAGADFLKRGRVCGGGGGGCNIYFHNGNLVGEIYIIDLHYEIRFRLKEGISP